MAWQGRVSTPGGLSQREVRQTARRTSPQKKLYDDGQTPEDLAKIKGDIQPEKVPTEGIVTEYGSPEYMKYLGIQPMRISPTGEVTILPDGATMFDHPATALNVNHLEKATVSQPGQKDAWVGWDHRGRARKRGDGEIPEWDHMALWSMTRREGSKLAFDPDVVREINRIVVDEFRRSQDQGMDKDGKPVPPLENGAKDIFLMPVHYDTDNVHIQAFVNRIPWDFEAKISGIAEKNNSFFDLVRAKINQRLKAAEIPLELLGEPAAAHDRKADIEDVQATARIMEDADLDIPPDLTLGRPKERAFRIVDMPELERHEEELTAELLDITRRQNLLTGALKQVQGAKALYVENATLKDEKAALEADKASLEENLATTRTELEETASTLATTAADLESANSSIEELADERDALTRTVAERDDIISARDRQIDELRELHATELEEAAERLAAVETSRDQWQASHAAVEEDLKAEQARHHEDNASAATEIEKLRAELASALAEGERAARDAATAQAQLEAEKAKGEAVQAKFDAYRSQVEQADDFEGQPLPGDGMDAIGHDRRKANPNVVFPEGVKASKRVLGRQRFELPDGGEVRVTRSSAKLASGTLTPTAIAVMVAHAQREGWTPITISARSPELVASIADAARKAGLVLEGEEPAASIAPARQRRAAPPSWSTKAPATWTKTEREAAQKALDKLKSDGKVPAALPLEDFGKRQFETYQQRQTTAEGGNDLEPKKPQ